MIDLYQSQVALRLNNNHHPRGNAIRAPVDTLSRDEIKREKEQFEDRGKHTISDDYTKDELNMVSRYFLQTNAPEDLSNRFDFLLGHSILARDEIKRKIQLPDLFLVHTLGRELKDARSKAHHIQTGHPLEHHSAITDTDVNAIHNAGQMEFSESGYGLKQCLLLPDAKKHSIYKIKERESLRSFYFSRTMCRQKRTVELATIRTKDRAAAAAERKFLKDDSNDALLFMGIRNDGTGVVSEIRGYDE